MIFNRKNDSSVYANDELSKKTVKFHSRLVNLSLSGMFLALCLLLPFLTMQIPQIGAALSPMHIPVFLCGFICGWQYGAVVGFTAPLLRCLVFSMPTILTAIPMAFELAVYGMVCALVYMVLPKKAYCVYISLLISMLAGRLTGGLISFLLAGIGYTEFSLAKFWLAYFVNAVPGIICHIIIVPIIIIALEKANLIKPSQNTNS